MPDDCYALSIPPAVVDVDARDLDDTIDAMRELLSALHTHNDRIDRFTSTMGVK